MTITDTLKAALDQMLAAEDPDEKARLRADFERQCRALFTSTRRTAPDWQRMAANDDREDA